MNPSIMVPKFLWNLYESGWVRVLCTDSFYLFALFDIPGLEKKKLKGAGTTVQRGRTPQTSLSPANIQRAIFNILELFSLSR